MISTAELMLNFKTVFRHLSLMLILPGQSRPATRVYPLAILFIHALTNDRPISSPLRSATLQCLKDTVM